jgi:hypothetical protein
MKNQHNTASILKDFDKCEPIIPLVDSKWVGDIA